jgi:predicted nucleic acid-binding protein
VIVVDASAILEILLNTSSASRIAERLFASPVSLHSPQLLDLEIAQVLRRYARTQQIDAYRSQEALQDFMDLPITRYPHQPLLPRVWELRHNFTAYDAAYLSLAEALGAPLVTRDAALAKAQGHEAVVEVV